MTVSFPTLTLFIEQTLLSLALLIPLCDWLRLPRVHADDDRIRGMSCYPLVGLYNHLCV